jgi:sugar lactone lactonase YvrE
LPTAGAACNDIAIGADGTAYATDHENMEIVALKPGAKSLTVWAGKGAFGPKGGMLDGIAIVRDRVVVNTLQTNRLFSVPIGADGRPGPIAEVKLDRPLKFPDGQRTFGSDGILIVDQDEGGRLMHITLAGEKLDMGKVKTLKTGFADGPASVAVVGQTAYVIEAQWDTAAKPPYKPFKATAVSLVP